MLKYVFVLVFLCGIRDGDSTPQNEPKSTEIESVGIKKSEVGANGSDNNSRVIENNFRNPIIEYLLRENPNDRSIDDRKNGIIREIRHSQTLLLPNVQSERHPPPVAELFPRPFSHYVALKKLSEAGNGASVNSHFSRFTEHTKNVRREDGSTEKTHESIITSPTLHLSDRSSNDNREEFARIQMYPAVAYMINTYKGDGTLKSSVTHFEPDFEFIKDVPGAGEVFLRGDAEKNGKIVHIPKYEIQDFLEDGRALSSIPSRLHSYHRRQKPVEAPSRRFAEYLPFAGSFPYGFGNGALPPTVYNAVSSIIEYGSKSEGSGAGKKNYSKFTDEKNSEKEYDLRSDDSKEKEKDKEEREHGDFFDELTLKSEIIKKTKAKEEDMRRNGEKSNSEKKLSRNRRQTTSVFLTTRQGDEIDITLEEPPLKTLKERTTTGSDLILRKGGIAIVGPGGAATAYTGGTAIVGPYGTVYKSPQGTAILGPFSKVVNITDDTDVEDIIRMHKQIHTPSRHLQTPTTAPTTAFKNFRNLFSYMTNHPIAIALKPSKVAVNENHRPNVLRLRDVDLKKAAEDTLNAEYRRIVEDTPFEQRTVKKNETSLVFRPKSKAEAGRNGMAVSAPSSHAILHPGQKADIYFEPESVASAGPSGFAHAHSDLFVSYALTNSTDLEGVLKNVEPLVPGAVHESK